MKLSSKKKTHKGPTRTEALAGVPEISPAINWETVENGEILIEYPLPLKPFFIQLVSRFRKTREQKLTKKVQLDTVGSLVWQMFNGENDVKQIIYAVSKEKRLSLHEAEISVTTFIRELGRRGLIHIR
ncbi:MAG: PqqD family protein [Desulforhopalus sp.]